MGTQARDGISKIVAIWIPIFAFVGLGYQHVVANMYSVPLALLQGSTTITTPQYIYKSMLPAAAGNIIGASLVALPFTALYLIGNEPSDADPSSLRRIFSGFSKRSSSHDTTPNGKETIA